MHLVHTVRWPQSNNMLLPVLLLIQENGCRLYFLLLSALQAAVLATVLSKKKAQARNIRHG